MTGVEPGVTDGCNPPGRATHAPDTVWGRPRGAIGLSIRELAERTGINRGEISRIERGRSCPSPDQARRLLDAFDEGGS
jgi:predicted transcriptional regulator